MKVIGFIGAYDKTDLILSIAKVLTVMNNKVLVIDSTINQKARYVVPAIDPTVSYITTFEDIDVAVGFTDLKNIKRYLSTENVDYDILLVDADTTDRVSTFNLTEAYLNYFVTSFDVYSLKKGLEILSNLQVPINLTKVLYSKDMSKEEDDYLNFLSKEYKINWENAIMYFPIENGDLSVMSENERIEKIKFKKMSIQFKDTLNYMVQQILGEKDDTNVRKAMKLIERGE